MSTDRILCLSEVKKRTGYGTSSIYKMQKAKMFPSRIKIGPNKVGWRESEVQNWLEKRIIQFQNDSAK